ncbi:MAG TPA: hypothetical protein VHM48_11420 [Candidatus Limnocylindrales bacterium]|nr:hypothetical protein [Candidatus Limnocylindrales bacterium]
MLTKRPDRALVAGGLAWARAGRALNDRRGQGVVEYGLILSLSAGLAVILLVFFGGTLSAVLKAVGDAIDAAS